MIKIEQGKKYLVTGGSGLVGSALKKIHTNYNHSFFFISSKNGDLTNYFDTHLIFSRINPVLTSLGSMLCFSAQKCL